MTVFGAVVSLAAAPDAATRLIVLALVFGGFPALVLYFFGRRIGGDGGGGEKDIVGVLWFAAAIVLGLALAHHR